MKRLLAVILAAAFFAFPLAVSAAVTSVPSSDLRIDRDAPVSVSGATLSGTSDNNLRLCFAFQNLAAKPITSVEFHFAVVDQFQSERISKTLVRNAASSFASGSLVSPPDFTSGSYSDTNDGSQSCWIVGSLSSLQQQLNGINNGGGLMIKAVAVTFNDGSIWRSGQSFARAYNYDGSSYSFVPQQFGHLTFRQNPNPAPIQLTRTSASAIAGGDRGKLQDCISFRDISNKVASSVSMNFSYYDASKQKLFGFNYTYDGTFTPPIHIENKCWTADLPAPALVSATKTYTVSITSVTFSDGSIWTPAVAWTRAYSEDGSAYTGAQPNVAANNNGAPAAANDNLGGIVGGTGQLYGAIAWDGANLSTFSIATNKTKVFDAQFDATAACKAKAGTNAENCSFVQTSKPLLNSSSSRCADVVSDGRAWRIGVAANADDAYLDALNQLRALGGAADSAKVLVKGCNDR
jgi:hypothetical protein